MQEKLNVKIFITAYAIIMHLNKYLKEECLIITNPNGKIMQLLEFSCRFLKYCNKKNFYYI